METASAVVADMVSVIGTTGTGFLQNDACWRELERLPSGAMRSPYYLRIDVEDVAGVLAQIALRLAAHRISIARLVQHQENGSATLHVVTHEGAEGDLRSALQEIESLPETTAPPSALPVVSDRGVPGLGWA
jgi:homoserine dehydrogenase